MPINQTHEDLRRRARNVGLRYKLLISLATLLILFVLVELALCGANLIINRIIFTSPTAIHASVTSGDGTDPMVILAVGDSFTWGGRAPGDESYPSHLFRELSERCPGRSFRVINGGACESNTLAIRRNLPAMLDKHRPDIVLLLTGSANLFSPWDYQYWADPSAVSASRSRLGHLRTVKMLRTLWINGVGHRLMSTAMPLYTRSRAGERLMDDLREGRIGGGSSSPAIEGMWRDHLALGSVRALAAGEEVLNRGRTDRETEAALCSMIQIAADLGRYDDASRWLDRSASSFPDSDYSGNCRSYALLDLCERLMTVQMRRPDLAVGFCLGALHSDPFDYYHYYLLAKALPLQSEVSADDIVRALEQVGDDHPDIRELKFYHDYLEIFRNQQDWERKAGRWIEDDLESIVALCRERDVRLVIGNYPMDYPLANGLLRTVAERHDLEFVDHLSTFQGLEPIGDFLFDDDHCTGKGHAVMARNVFAVLDQTPGFCGPVLSVPHAP
ncbi:MAG: hypothetical protein IT350_04355 [Deltaproteobacteria bacterium]|nr:hypothetical protein [Deltaproteobacteria bacterium]